MAKDTRRRNIKVGKGLQEIWLGKVMASALSCRRSRKPAYASAPSLKAQSKQCILQAPENFVGKGKEKVK
jgi:hypothetical protein